MVDLVELLCQNCELLLGIITVIFVLCFSSLSDLGYIEVEVFSMHMYMSIIIEVGRPSSLMCLPLLCLHALVVCTAGCSILGEISST